MAGKKQSKIEKFKELLDRNLLESPDYSSMPKTRYFAPQNPHIKLPPLPTPEQEKKKNLATYLLAATASPSGKLSGAAGELAGKQGADTEEPSLLSKIFDTMSAPLYASYSALGALKPDEDEGFFENLGDELTGIGGAIAGGIAQGAKSASSIFEGTPLDVVNFTDFLPDDAVQNFADKHAPKRLGSDILGDAGVNNPVAKYGGGFALDILADPLTYIPGLGLGKAFGKGARAADKILEARAAEGDAAKAFVKPPVAEKPNLNQPIADALGSADRVDTSFPRIDFNSQTAGRHRSNIPETPDRLDPDMSWGPGDVTMRILNDPELMDAMKAERRSDNARRAANTRHHGDPEFVNPRTATEVDQADFAVNAQKMLDAKLLKQGKVTTKGGVHKSLPAIEKVLNDIETGAIPRFGPEPAAATGMARNVAIEKADDFITSLVGRGKKRSDLNPANQANLYNKLYNAAVELTGDGKKITGAARETARQMLRTAEDHAIRLGKQPVYWNGMRVRLSDVLEEIGPNATDELATKVLKAFVEKDLSKVSDPAVAEAINRALARRALNNSDLMQNISNYARNAKNSILDKYNYPTAKRLTDALQVNARTAMRNMGMTEAEANTVADLVRNIVDVDKLPAERMMEELGPALTKAMQEGRMDLKSYRKIIKSIQKTVGDTPERLAKDVSGNRAIDTFMTALSTSYGRLHEMKQFSDGAFAWGEKNAIDRAKWFRDKVKGYSKDEIYNAFLIAQNIRELSTVEPKVQTLARQFQDYFETMLGSSGFNDLKDFEGTVAARSQLFMAEVNKQLRIGGSHFEFRAPKKAKNILGTPRDYSEKGVGWLKYWENADPKKIGQDPISFMYDLDLAIERVVREHSLVDSFVTHFGATKLDAHFDPRVHVAQIGHQRAHGYYFPQEQRDQMMRLLHDLDEGVYKPNSELLKHYSRGLRAWKTGVTIYLPSHHIRNLIGDLHFMWWDGFNDPRNFVRARKVMASQRHQYKEALQSDTLDALRNLVDKDALEWAKTSNDSVILRRNGVNLNAGQLYIAAHQHGLLRDANKLEDIFGESPLSALGEKLGGKLGARIDKPLNGNAHKVAAGVAEYREHYIRLSHFIAAVDKGLKKSKDINKVFDEAAATVRKWHPDGTDLTKFEQKLRYLIPFYSWQRKAFPLVVQTAVQRPAKMLYYPRAMLSLQGMLGQDDNTILDPFPDNQLFPDWIRAKGIGPIGDPESLNPISSWWGRLGQNSIGIEGQETGYTIVNPSNPFQDLISETFGMGTPQDTLKGVGNALTPALGIPMDLLKNSTFTGQAISKDEGGRGYLNYAVDQVPILSALNNVLEINPSTMQSRNADREGVEKGADIQALINYITALGVRGTGPLEKSAEFEARDRLRNK